MSMTNTNGGNPLYKKNNKYFWFFIILLNLLFISLNLPTAEVTKAFVILDSPLGSFSVTRILIIILFFISILFLLENNSSLYFTRGEIYLYIIALIIILNVMLETTSSSKVVYFFFIIYISFFIGRITGLKIKPKIIVNIIQVATIVQVLLVLYSIYVGPFDFTAVEGRDLFRDFNNKIVGVSFNQRIIGTIGHPVVLASFLTPGVIVYFIKFIVEDKNKIINFVCFSLTLYIIFLTSSRGTWLILFFLFLYLAFKFKLYIKVRYILLFTIAFFSILLGPFLTYIIGRLSLTTIADGSVSHRLYMHYWSINEALSNPITFLTGSGIGSSYNLLKLNPPPDSFLVIDNIYLTLLIETGFLGLGLFIAIFIFALKTTSSSHDLFILKVIVIAMLMNGLTYDLFYWEQVSIILWVIIGFLISFGKMPNKGGNKI